MRVSIWIAGPSERCSSSAMSRTQVRHVDRLGLQLLAAREGQHALGQRGAALRGLDRVVDELPHAWDRPAGACAASSRLPSTTASRLLKSCAMPPVSWPMASIFCDWNKRRTGLLERLLRFLALGDIARDLGEADEVAVLVADRIDDHIGPEAGAVLADAPALLLEAALAGGGLKRSLRAGRPARSSSV